MVAHWRLLYRTCARFSLVFQLRSTSSNLFSSPSSNASTKIIYIKKWIQARFFWSSMFSVIAFSAVRIFRHNSVCVDFWKKSFDIVFMLVLYVRACVWRDHPASKLCICFKILFYFVSFVVVVVSPTFYAWFGQFCVVQICWWLVDINREKLKSRNRNRLWLIFRENCEYNIFKNFKPLWWYCAFIVKWLA